MRIRPLRTPTDIVSVGDLPPPFPDPPDRMRAAVMDTDRRCRRAARVIHPCSEPRAQRTALSVSSRPASTRSMPRRGQARASQGRRGRSPRLPVTTSAASWCVRRTSRTSFPPGYRGLRDGCRFRGRAALTPSTLVVPTLSVARKPASLSHVEAAGVPLAALTAWGLVVETAHAHEGQRILIHAGSGGVGHFAVQLVALFRGRTSPRPGRPATSRGSESLGASNGHRLHDQAVSTRRASMSMSSSTSSAMLHEDTGTRSLLVSSASGGLYVPVPTGSLPRATRAATAAAGVRTTTYKVVPDGVELATLGKTSGTPARSRCTSTGSSISPRRRQRMFELEKGHTRGKIVLRVSDD